MDIVDLTKDSMFQVLFNAPYRKSEMKNGFKMFLILYSHRDFSQDSDGTYMSLYQILVGQNGILSFRMYQSRSENERNSTLV